MNTPTRGPNIQPTTHRPNTQTSFIKKSAALAALLSVIAAPSCENNENEIAQPPVTDAGSDALPTCKGIECPPGKPTCSNGVCFDTNEDVNFCTVEADCDVGEMCLNTFCAPVACQDVPCNNPAEQQCGIAALTKTTACYNANEDEKNCGAIDIACGQGETCMGGICADTSCSNVACPDKTPNCGEGICFDARTDVKNCGQYGNDCTGTAFPYCEQGKCSDKIN